MPSRDRLLVGVLAGSTLLGGLTVATTRSGADGTPVAALVTPTAVATATPSPTPVVTPRPTPSRTARPVPTRAAVRSTYPLPAPPVHPEPCPLPTRTGPPGKPRPLGSPVVAEVDVPAPVRLPARKVDLRPARGKGMWLTTWPKTTFDAERVVARAKAAGLTQVWLRTGGSKQGYYGDRLLAALLPRAHAAGIKVIAWDFPTLSDPTADAARVARALAYSVDGHRIDGVAPDIESTAEGVHQTAKRMRYYLSLVVRAAGNRPVVSTVPRPTPRRLASYPYAAQVPYVDAFASMVYWSCNEPGKLVLESLQRLGRLGRPVAVVGQAYNMGSEGGRRGVPSALETWRFLDVAKRHGALGASLYQYDTAGAGQWNALAAYRWR